MAVPIKIIAEDLSVPTTCFSDLLDVHIGNREKVSTLLKNDLVSSSRGLHLLAAAVPLMSEDELAEKSTPLIALCLKVCKKHAHTKVDAAIAYDILGKLLDRCRDLPNVEVIVSVKVITEFIQQCLPQTSPAEKLPSLICLHIFVTRYIKHHLIAQRAHIEKYLIQFLDSDDVGSIVMAAKIAHLLQQIRSQGESGPPKRAWREQLERLCQAAQDIITELYSGATDFYRSNASYFETVPTDTTQTFRGHLSLALESLHEITSAENGMEKTAVSRVVSLVTRLNNVLIFIQAMLVERFPGMKAVRPHPVLECVIRLLGVNVSYHAKSADLATLAALNAGVRLRALDTLDALIHCLGTNLMPYSSLIFRLAFQSLRWSKDHTGTCGKNVRAKAYSTISLWLTTLKCHQFVRRGGDGPDQEEELVNSINDDIAEKKNIIELMINPQSKKNMAKRAQRKLVNSQLGKSTLALHAPGAKKLEEKWNSMGNKVALEALNCLRVLLHTCGIFLKPSTYNHISSFLLPICLALHRSELSFKTDPYYRLSLYQCVEALQIGCKSSVVAPTQYCLHLYGLGQHDRDSQVAIFCNRALSSLRSSLHGVPPTLSFGLSVEDETENDDKVASAGVSKHAVSKRNLAVLNSLLGEDRFQTIDVDDIDDSSPQEEPSTFTNNTEELQITGQKRKQSEECEENDSKYIRLSASPTTSDNIIITSSEDETEITDSPSKKNNDLNEFNSQSSENTIDGATDKSKSKHSETIISEPIDIENSQTKDNLHHEENGSNNHTNPEMRLIENSSNKIKSSGSVSIQNVEQEVIYIDDDADKLVSKGDDEISEDLTVTAEVKPELENALENVKELAEAETDSNLIGENVNGNLSVDEMMADFVDAVVG